MHLEEASRKFCEINDTISGQELFHTFAFCFGGFIAKNISADNIFTDC